MQAAVSSSSASAAVAERRSQTSFSTTFRNFSLIALLLVCMGGLLLHEYQYLNLKSLSSMEDVRRASLEGRTTQKAEGSSSLGLNDITKVEKSSPDVVKSGELPEAAKAKTDHISDGGAASGKSKRLEMNPKGEKSDHHHLSKEWWRTVVRPLFPQTLNNSAGIGLLQRDYEGTRSCPSVKKDETLRETIKRLASLTQTQTRCRKHSTTTLCLGGDQLGDWRPVLASVVQAVKLHGIGEKEKVSRRHVYEFGVSYGFSTVGLWQILRPNVLWGFDSFKGLPPVDVTVDGSKTVWKTGEYAADPREKLSSLLGTMNIGWIPGWFNESLLDDAMVVERGMQPALYVDIDVDYYSSSFQALDFLFRNKLIVPGTIIGYDDWWVEACSHAPYEHSSPLEIGQGKAHVDIVKKYDVEFFCAAGSCTLPTYARCDAFEGWAPSFVVLSIGEGKASHGFEMTTQSQVRSFKMGDNRCMVWKHSSFWRKEKLRYPKWKRPPFRKKSKERVDVECSITAEKKFANQSLSKEWWRTVVRPLFPQTLNNSAGIGLLQRDYEGTRSCPSVQKNETLRETIKRLLAATGVGSQTPSSSPRQDVVPSVKTALGVHHRCGVEGDWRAWLSIIAEAVKLHGIGGNVSRPQVYQFGIRHASTVLQLWHFLRPHLNRLWGFDASLPSITKLSSPLLGTMNVGWISGWFNESLLDDAMVVERGMQPALYVDIDVDYYSSSFQALDFLFRNKLIVPGTIIGYDDWWDKVCGQEESRVSPLEIGQGKAHVDIVKKYDVEFFCAAGSCTLPTYARCDAFEGWAPSFVVLSIGEGKASHGFELTDRKVIQDVKKKDHRCKKHFSKQ